MKVCLHFVCLLLLVRFWLDWIALKSFKSLFKLDFPIIKIQNNLIFLILPPSPLLPSPQFKNLEDTLFPRNLLEVLYHYRWLIIIFYNITKLQKIFSKWINRLKKTPKFKKTLNYLHQSIWRIKAWKKRDWCEFHTEFVTIWNY